MEAMIKPFHSRTDNTKDDWRTPLEIVTPLGEFDLDPCAALDKPTRLARVGYTIHGLETEWVGRVWLNPPYGDSVVEWVAKLSLHGNGIALIVPRTGSQWFHSWVFSKASALLFIRGRIAFLDSNWNPVKGNNADSVLVAYGDGNVKALAKVQHVGRLVIL